MYAGEKLVWFIINMLRCLTITPSLINGIQRPMNVITE